MAMAAQGGRRGGHRMNTETIDCLLQACAALDGVWTDLMACYGDADPEPLGAECLDVEPSLPH